MIATRRGRWVVGGVAVLVVLAVAVVTWAGPDEDRPVRGAAGTTTPAAAPIAVAADGTPAWFDAEKATAVYESGSYDVDAAAAQYAESRIGRPATVGITVEPAVVTNHPGGFDTAAAAVRTASGLAAVIHLRIDGGEREWEVVGAFIDGVEVQGATFADGQARVRGVNRSGLPARLIQRHIDGTVIDEQPLTTAAFDVSTPTRVPILVAVVLDREPNAPVGFAEVRIDAPQVDAIWPGEATDESPEEAAKRFATEELSPTAQIDSTSVRPDAATFTFRLFGPDGTEWSGVIVELKALDGHWFVTSAYSRDITVSFTVDVTTKQVSYTVSSLDAEEVWVEAPPPGSGLTAALDRVSPVTPTGSTASGTVLVEGPAPRVLVVRARSAERGDAFWLQRITA
jgi:hypothetical protein